VVITKGLKYLEVQPENLQTLPIATRVT